MTDIDIHSRTWKALAAWAGAEIATAQGKLEQPGMDMNTTEGLRARIMALRDLLKKGGPAPAPLKIPASRGYSD